MVERKFRPGELIESVLSMRKEHRITEKELIEFSITESINRSRQFSNVRFGIVSLIPLEMEAINQVFGEAHQIDSGVPGVRYFLYNLACRDNPEKFHLILHAVATRSSFSSIPVIVTCIAKDCPSLRLLMYVGISQGIYRQEAPIEDQIRLGNIIVSDRRGIVHLRRNLNRGRRRDMKLSAYSIFQPPDPEALTWARCAASELADRPSTWSDRIGEIVDRAEELQWPTIELDPHYNSKLERALTGQERYGPTRVHFGAFATADQFNISSKEVKECAEDVGVIAVDFEAGGFASGVWEVGVVRYLVVKGVYRYLGEKGDISDAWRKSSALSAAAFVRAMISIVDPDTGTVGESLR